MKLPIVFDASALVALFNAEAIAYDYWSRADIGEETVVFPAVAVADANVVLGASYDDWSHLLWAEGVSVAPLDGSSAVETGRRTCVSLSIAHAVQEAKAVGGAVLTSWPHAYGGAVVPVLVLKGERAYGEAAA